MSLIGKLDTQHIELSHGNQFLGTSLMHCVQSTQLSDSSGCDREGFYCCRMSALRSTPTIIALMSLPRPFPLYSCSCDMHEI